jgi:hypothetical protein
MAVMEADRLRPLSEVDCDVAVIGAGPHGLSTAIRLRRAGIDTKVFGDCMSFWRQMPKGMLLRSNWSASHILEPPGQGEHSLGAFKSETGRDFGQPVPLDDFIAYGQWIQQRALPDLDPRMITGVERQPGRYVLTCQDGEQLTARRVVVACGISQFAWRPPQFHDLPAELATHTNDHADLSRFAGQRVAVVGGGQSALESSALMHEAGADVHIMIRRPHVVWLRGAAVIHKLGRLGPVVYAPTDVGPLWYSRLVAAPRVFGRLPRGSQTRIAKRCIRPAGSHWVRQRLGDVDMRFASEVIAAERSGNALELTFNGGAKETFDHMLFGTGYRVDASRYAFLSPGIKAAMRRANGYPILGRGLESSVEGLHFTGAPASWSYGPIMRFVSGSWYASETLTRSLAERGTRVGR